MRFRTLAVAAALLCTISALVAAEEINYREDFALAKDRGEALKQLIPGTEAYYYYHCLHYQNTEQFAKVDEMLAAWIKRHKYTTLVQQIRNRQALLTYRNNPARSLAHLRDRMNVQFNHQRIIVGQKPNLPTQLNNNLISRETLRKRALQKHQNLNGFEDSALQWLIGTELNADRRRHLLARLKRPDHADLARLVVADLNHRYSRGFGSHPVHAHLLLSQLEDCVKRKPDLLNQSHFVNAYLQKLAPSADQEWQNDPAALRAYLERLAKFTARLAPVHNSLKAHVAYHRLVLDRAAGVYNKQRFMDYIKLPRNAGYMNRDFMRRDASRRYAANLKQNFDNLTGLPVIGNDEPLVRSYLHHFFQKETTYQPYALYIDDTYLKHQFAETKIVNGLGEPEQWYSLLPPATYRTLKDRVDLDFAATNKTVFAADQPVSLDVHVKNVKSLIVKVYDINAGNYYRREQREVNTDINLDGLVANVETTHQYAEPPLRRVRRHFEFPGLNKPGVYVVDFIGNGKSSRVVVRKGKLRHLVHTTVAGHLFTIMDEKDEPVQDASLWMAGHEYKPDEDGLILVPFSNRPGRQAFMLTRGEFASLGHFQHESESYRLSAGIYVDRESLLKRQSAQVVLRPGLWLNGNRAPLKVLEDVTLVITSTDHDGVATTKEVPNFELFADRESTYEFAVPARLSQLTFTLKAKVQNLSQSQKQNLSSTQSFALNAIDRGDKIEDLHLSHAGGLYAVDLLGKSGEPKEDRAVQLTLKHRDFRDHVHVTLKTNAAGRVELGPLADIVSVSATSPSGVAHKWNLLRDRHSSNQIVHGVVGQPIVLPYMGKSDKPRRDELSLLEVRRQTFSVDRFAALTIENGLVHVNGLEAGDYDLLLKHSGRRIRLRLTAGKTAHGYVLGEYRQLEMRGRPLQIAAVEPGDDKIKIRLEGASAASRLHVFATRFQPAFDAYGILGRVGDVEPLAHLRPRFKSLYAEGRNIGDEYRYIIDRKYARKFPGNMLERPSPLLNPWAIRKTESGTQRAAGGDDFAADPSASPRAPARPKPKAERSAGLTDFANLDFLANGTAVLVNLRANDEGVIEINRADLPGNQHLHLVAVDTINTAYRVVALPERAGKTNDLRLATGLDPNKHFTQQKQISVVNQGQSFELPDITTARYESYDSLRRVYSLFVTLSGDSKLVEFGFLLNWPKLKLEEKRDLYSRYACHELHFFLARKDPKFFAEVIQPYLANKKDKTFLDHWLLAGDLRGHLQPWSYTQLNTAERVLLGQRVDGEALLTARHIGHLNDLIPPNIDRFNHLFDTALKGSALEGDEELDKLRNEAKKAAGKLGDLRDRFAMPRPGAGAAGPGNGPIGGGGFGGRGGSPAPAKPGEPGDLDDAEKELAKANKKVDAKRKSKNAAGLTEELAEVQGLLSARGLLRRGRAQQFYRKLDKTQEWVENNYYKLPIEQQNAKLVGVNAFWNDYAQHDPAKPFHSIHLAEATSNFTEMMLALGVLDLPFDSPDHDREFAKTKMTLEAAGPMVVFHEQIKEAEQVAEQTPILVSQNFFRDGDRYRQVNNERLDKFVTEEFLVHTVYGCQVVVTNPTSSRQKLSLLLQIPNGALPVKNGRYTRSVNVDLQPYNTRTIDYYFYFPAAGKFTHYPVHVAKNEQLLAHASAMTLNVVEKLTRVDKESWAYISQNGSDEDVVGYLRANNLHNTKLDMIAFRMKDKAFFQRVTELLARNHAYNHTLWSYGILHDAPTQVTQFLHHADQFVAQCGPYIDSPLLVIDPVVRKTYQHMDYRPLVNARAHQLGRRRQILNNRFHAQYHRLLNVLSYRRELSDDDLMSVTYYLLLQDRVEEGLDFFGRVNADNLATRLQYDYFAAYLDFYSDDHELAGDIAARYAEYPVDRWRKAFAEIRNQLAEINGGKSELIDKDDRTQQQTRLASAAANFDFQVESRKVRLNYQNLSEVQVNYYLMDLELLFSRNPFVQQYSGQFAYIRPNQSQVVKLADGKSKVDLDLPAELHNENVLVEISGGGQTKSQAYYSNSLTLQMVQNYGQLRLTTANPGRAISKAYVKVYARMKDGTVRFYKDGYTDLRGRFDYTSLNTNEIDFVDKFSLLVITDDHGAIVREATPPKR